MISSLGHLNSSRLDTILTGSLGLSKKKKTDRPKFSIFSLEGKNKYFFGLRLIMKTCCIKCLLAYKYAEMPVFKTKKNLVYREFLLEFHNLIYFQSVWAPSPTFLFFSGYFHHLQDFVASLASLKMCTSPYALKKYFMMKKLFHHHKKFIW